MCTLKNKSGRLYNKWVTVVVLRWFYLSFTLDRFKHFFKQKKCSNLVGLFKFWLFSKKFFINRPPFWKDILCKTSLHKYMYVELLCWQSPMPWPCLPSSGNPSGISMKFWAPWNSDRNPLWYGLLETMKVKDLEQCQPCNIYSSNANY